MVVKTVQCTFINSVFCILAFVHSEAHFETTPSSDVTTFLNVSDVQQAGKIIGGEQVAIERVPFLVSVQYSPFGDYFAHRCGGTLIAHKFVVTAAHCMVYVTEPHQLQIRAGSTQQTEGGQTKTVAKYFIHPEYNATTYQNDIAVLKLTGRIWTSQPANIVESLVYTFTSPLLPKAPKTVQLSTLTEEDLPQNAEFYTAGWGTTAVGGLAEDTLYGLTVPLINHTVCRQMYPMDKIKTSMVCAGYLRGGRDTCQGDSGGPLIYYNKLFGMVSWGDGCAEANKPGVYTRISAFRDYINRIVKNG